jgi:hypothetical protein
MAQRPRIIRKGRPVWTRYIGASFVPSDIASLTAWWDAALGVTIGGFSGEVSQWDDQSLNGYNLIQGTANKQPIMDGAAINDLPALTFDGVNDSIDLASALTGLSNSTYFVVLNRPTSSNVHSIIGGSGPSDLMCGQSGTNMYMGSRAKAHVMANNAWEIRCCVGHASPVSSDFYINGTSLGSTSGGASSTHSSIKKVGNSALGEAFGGKIAEIIVYNAVLSAGDITSVTNYLNSKYAIF